MYSGRSHHDLSSDEESEDDSENSDDGTIADNDMERTTPELGAFDFTAELPSMRNGGSMIVAL